MTARVPSSSPDVTAPVRASRAARTGAAAALVAAVLGLHPAAAAAQTRDPRARAAPPTAAAPPPDAPSTGAQEAERHLRRALAHYESRAYDRAAAEFSAAYRLDPKRDLLYAWAQAARLAGDCSGAVGLYRRFLAERPPASEAARARANMDRCQGQSPGNDEDARADANTLGGAGTPVMAERPAGPPWYADRRGGALAGLAALAGGTCLGLAIASGQARADAGKATTYERAEDRQGRANDLRTASILAGGAAVGLLAAAAVRYALAASPSRRAQAAATAGVAPEGGFLVGLRLAPRGW